jgi:DNA processing protein
LEDRKYWLGFSLIQHVGPKTLLRLCKHFDSLKQAWNASPTDLRRAGLSENAAKHISQQRAEINLDRELQRIRQVDATFRTILDDDYPEPLKDIDDPPPVLYVRGTLTPQDANAICIVGTRKASIYGRDAAYQLSKDLAANGVTIISGLAHGIDTVAHEGALDAGGRTIAVTASGISEIYPADNLPLAHRIIQQGAVVTEFSIGTPPIGRNFPRRNRILSGLAHGVLVIEAGERSGALITAELAAEQGRDVFAVPGNIFNQAARGTNRLIQDGAKLVTQAADILEEIEGVQQHIEAKETLKSSDNPIEQTLLDLLGPDPIHVDHLSRLSKLPIEEITSTLTLLELKGLARNVGQMQYILSR